MLKVAFKSVIPGGVGIGFGDGNGSGSKMIVCLCKGVGCGAIRNAIAEGATSVEEIGRACGAGTDCGGCEGTIEDIIEQEVGAPALAACKHRSLPVIRAA